MYQRKEKVDKPSHGHQDEVLDLFNLLESSDPEVVESVKNVIHENLSGTKDSRFLYVLLDYHLTVQSKRSLDILLRVKDPHDKHLFDKINELMRNENSRYQSLQLLCNLVYNQPSWLHRIANHRVINTLLQVLKTDLSAPNLMSGIFILICLLPMIPSQFGPFLPETFDIFSRLAAWNIKKPNSIQDIYMLHLQVGIHSLFHHLYGMFPCNFLAYLRSYYGGRDNNEETFKIFSLVIKPLLERVRLHPLLVTASKETELSATRWKKMAYHDIIVDCASVFIDSTEGSLEGLGQKRQPFDSVAVGRSSASNQDTINLENFSSRSNSLSMNIESGSLVKVAMNSNEETMWSPSHACGFSTPSETSSIISPAPPVKSDWEAKSFNTQLSTESSVQLDFAIEAKPEVLKEEHGSYIINEKEKALSKILPKDLKSVEVDAELSAEDSNKISEPKEKSSSTKHTQSFEQESILPGVEAKEDDLDKEVCDLTSNQHSSEKSDVEARQNTPFCCTTQNLTDEPDNLHNTEISSSTKPNVLTKSSTSEDNDEMPSLQDIDMDAFVPTFSRYRYFSHCGPPPDIPSQPSRRKVYRSRSCPANFCPNIQASTSVALNDDLQGCPKSDITQPSTSRNEITSASVSLNSGSSVMSKDGIVTYNDLIPMALNFLPNTNKSGDFAANYCNRNSFLNTLSPSGLLDHYIQLGSVTYVSHLNTIPITSTNNTDWTHFGGKAPPDEIAILRNQILLLHNQLLFERHRKNVHSERNRRILGRAKKCKMQEENIVALKQKITLLEKDNQDLKNELAYQLKLYQQLRTEKQQTENELNLHISKISQENSQLLFSNKKLQSLLVSQKQENDEIREEYKKCQSEVVDLRVELKLCRNEMMRCQKLEKEAVFLSKQLILLQELNSRCKEKMEAMKEPPLPDIELDLLREASALETKDLKQKLDVKNAHLDACKSKITDLEQLCSTMKSKLKEQALMIEDMKSFHKDEIAARDEYAADLKRTSIQQDAHILSLFKDMDSLSEKIKNLEKQQNEEASMKNLLDSTVHSISQAETNAEQLSSSES